MSGKNLSPSHIIITTTATHLLQSLLLPRLPEAESLLPRLGARPLRPRGPGSSRPRPRPLREHCLRVPGGVGRVLAAAPLHAAVDSVHDVGEGQRWSVTMVIPSSAKTRVQSGSVANPCKRTPGTGYNGNRPQQ